MTTNNDVSKNHLHIIAGFRSSDGEVIISALSYISNTTQVMENLDSKLQTTRQAFKSAGYDLDGKQSKGKEVATESIVTSFYELSSIANLSIPAMFTQLLNNFGEFFQMGNTFIEESDKFHKLKEDLNKRLNANTFKQQTHAPYVDVTVNQILESENRTKRDLPRVIEMIQMHLIKNGLSSKGIFREATDSAKTIQEICLRMSATNFFELSPITTATVYKKFLRDLPEHIFNEEQTNAIVGQINPTMTTTTPELISLLRTTVDQLPQEHNTIFKNVVRLCSKIDKNQEVNSMSATNLAVCLTPSIFTIPDDENGPKTLAASLIIMRKYIEEFSSIFPRFADPTYQLGSERKRKNNTPNVPPPTNNFKSIKPKDVDEKKQFLVRDNNVLINPIMMNQQHWLEDEVIQPTDSKQRFIIGKRKEKQVQQSKVEDNNEEQNEEHIENHDDYQNEEYVENQDDYQGEEYLENFNEDQVNQEVEEQNDDIHEKYQNNQCKRKTFHPKANDQNSTEDGSELMSLLSKRRGKLGDD
ncbi:RhoGAP domain containing protein [Entamoeba marina]